ncbi:hypothetical protein [Microbulbifer sp. ARAS458-1]|uniref:hypothetical protein n=1 Tax=Microbulbifer sp. ARAS458-1 TaxID=3140242 RepID=UPI003877CA2B
MKVVLHIGTEKTGTTSIQKFIKRNREALSDQNVFVVPSILGDGNNFEFVLASSIDPGSDLGRHRPGTYPAYQDQQRKCVCKTIQELPENATLLLSSEHFSSRLSSKRDIEILKSLFPDSVDFEIVVYLKRQDDLYLGSFSEAIKAGVPFSKIARMGDVMSSERYGSAYYNYKNLLSNWLSVFDEASLNVRLYDGACKSASGLMGDFSRVINFESADFLEGVEQENRSLSPESLFSIGALCDKYRHIPRVKIISILQKVDPFEKGAFFESESLSEFFSKFKESNSWVSNQFFEGVPIFEDVIREVRCFDISNREARESSLNYVMTAFDEYLDCEGELQ